MAEPTAADLFALDMLGPDLRDAVLAARDRLDDETISARIAQGLVYIERGDPVVVLHGVEDDGVIVSGQLSYDAAVAYLGALT